MAPEGGKRMGTRRALFLILSWLASVMEPPCEASPFPKRAHYGLIKSPHKKVEFWSPSLTLGRKKVGGKEGELSAPPQAGSRAHKEPCGNSCEIG